MKQRMLSLSGYAFRLAFRAFFIFSAVAFATGCATLAPRQADQPSWTLGDEQLLFAHSGRFALQIAQLQHFSKGIQGRFEWLELKSSTRPGSRQILAWIGPLGQSLGRIELKASIDEDRVSIFDDQGRMLTIGEQSAFLEQALGYAIEVQDVTSFALRLMQFFKLSLSQTQPIFEGEFPLDRAVVKLRVVPDA